MHFRSFWSLLVLSAAVLCAPLRAAVLPEDRADALYHRYDGGGVEVDGPSILVRKGNDKSLSAFANYNRDSVTSASIDVVTQGSPYDEQRTQYSVGLDYLRGKSIMNLSYTNSDESDYSADTVSFGVSMDMFGDLTNVSMGFSRGWDDVERNGDPDFEEEVDRKTYRVGLSQVLTKNSLLGIAWETISDEGFLNNPYRSVRYLDPGSGIGYSFQPERYPNTRNSNALAVRALYYLPFRAATRAEYRYFTDSWNIDAHTAEAGYTHPFGHWIIDLKFRYYTQTSADFYSDLYPFRDAQNFLARDKELSSFDSYTAGVGLSYEFARGGWGFIDKGSLNFAYDYIYFDYDDYRDIRDTSQPPGQEDPYSFSADVFQLYLSIWY